MIEYLLFPAAALVLAGAVAVQFLLQGVVYGPRTRRIMALLVVPAAVLWGVLAVSAGGWRWARVILGALVATTAYLAVATAVVLHWRNRKLTALVGDVGALRRRMAERRRDLDRLFWEMSARPAPRPQAAAVSQRRPGEPRRSEWVPVVANWQRADGPRVSARSAQVAQWRAEFETCDRTELAARARVLEAAAADQPPEHAQALTARLAVLWLVYSELPDAPDPAAPGRPAARARWDSARQELAHLQEELAHVLSQRGLLMRRKLPLD